MRSLHKIAAGLCIFVFLFQAKVFAGNKGKDSTALKRKLIISAGIGDPAVMYIDNFVKNNYKWDGSYKIVPTTNPLYAKVEYRLFKHFGVGVDVSYDDYEQQKAAPSGTVYTDQYKGHTFVADIRLNKHFHLLKKRLDFYVGAGLGYEINSATNIADTLIKTNNLPKNAGHNLAYEVTIGGRFYITKRVGIYIEGGIARSILQGGLVVRL